MRRALIITGGLAGLALAALAAVPWWLGAALALGGRPAGVTFKAYQRIGYTRFALEGVEARRPGLAVSVARLEADSPLVWLFRRWVSRPGAVLARDWRVEVAESSGAPPTEPGGWAPSVRTLERVLAGAEHWLPEIDAEAGVVRWPGGDATVSSVVWKDGGLKIGGLRCGKLVADAELRRAPAGEGFLAEARAANGVWRVGLKGDERALAGRGELWGQTATLSAEFAETGWLPERADVAAEEWSVAGGRIRLGQLYETVGGRARVRWREGRLSADVNVAGTPAKGGEAPPLKVVLHGTGGGDALRIDRLEVEIPGVEARLSQPVALDRGGIAGGGGAVFALDADLAKQPWVKAGGRLAGTVTMSAAAGRAPVFDGVFSAAGASVAGWAIRKADVKGRLEWPRLSVAEAKVELNADERVTLAGTWDFSTRTLSAGTVAGRLKRATLARWLPPEVKFESVEAQAKAEGAWPELKHEGTLTVEALSGGPLRPAGISAKWRGTGPELTEIGVTATAGETTLAASGAWQAEALRVDALTLSQGGAERLRLTAPTRVRWKPALAVDAFELKGPEGMLAGELASGAGGHARLAAHNLKAAWWRGLIDWRGPDWTLDSLEARGDWARGPMTFTVKGAASAAAGTGRAELRVTSQGGKDGAQIEVAGAGGDGQVIAQATGVLPLTLWPGQSPWLRLDRDAPLSLRATTRPEDGLWSRLEALTGLVVTGPQLDLNVTGSWARPSGTLRLQVAHLALADGKRARIFPTLDNLEVDATGDRAGVAVKTFSARVAGQEIRASGRLPVSQWEALLAHPLERIEAQGEARLEIPDAQVAALARYLPEYLAPAGRLQVDVSLRPGGQLDGFLKLRDAVSRPLGPLGILQGIAADVAFTGRSLELKRVTATTGGRPVTLSGRIGLPEDGKPRLALALKGENLPFVRQAGLLLRGDVDLKLETADDGSTRITGGSRLRDSLFLVDVRALLPGGGVAGATERRPPYFSIGLAPFASWQLDVKVDGDRFLKLRTPVFTGLASAHFRLGGTLGDPRLTGEATVADGRVLLPFATFAVEQANVRLSEANPFQPQVSLTGTSRRYGYDLRMEISGPADHPRLVFTSSPGLESEQVLLMVMAGQVPQDEITYTGQQRALRLGAYFGQSLLGSLGLDAGDGDKLSLVTGEKISQQGRETYSLEYALDKRWSLVGEYDEFDDYNVGVKLHLLPKKPKEAAGDGKK